MLIWAKGAMLCPYQHSNPQRAKKSSIITKITGRICMAELERQTRSTNESIYRRNFIYFLTDNVLFNLAMSIISPTTLIPDFIRHLTQSEVLIGFCSNMFEVGWALPQLFITRYIARSERKKWWFVGPNIPVRFVILGFGLITVILGKDRPGAILLAFLTCYGIAAIGDGLVGVPWAILTGTSLDSRWRARMFGLTSASTGLLMLAVAPVIGLVLSSTALPFPNNYALIFGAAGLLFVISILPVLFVQELPGGKVVDKIPSMAEFLPSLGHVLRTDIQFRAMIITRMFTSLFTMASPFYIGFATVQLGLSSKIAVPTLLAMQTIGSISGALIYTWLGARNNVLFVRLALAGASLLPVSALLASRVGPFPLYLGFLISGITLSNLFSGFQNWVITYPSADQRPVYAGLFNTVTAIVSLIAPFIGGTIAQQTSYETLFVVALVMVLIALFITLRYLDGSHHQESAA
jgi:MFS family permease